MSAPDFFHDEQECLETEAVTWVVRLTSGEATEGDAYAMAVWRRRSNTQAAVAVHYNTDTTRRVDLLDGEAVFRVMKDAARPFLVQAQNG